MKHKQKQDKTSKKINWNKILKSLELGLRKTSYETNKRHKGWSLGYFLMQKDRYKHALILIERYYCKGNILEIGSLPAHITYCLKKAGYPVQGLDINPARVKKFIKKHELNIKKCDIDKDKLPFRNNSFSLVIFNEVLEHLKADPRLVMKEIKRVLQPEGMLILTTPNLYSIKNIISFNLGKGLTDPFDTLDQARILGHAGHIREYSVKNVKKLLEHAGLKLIKIKHESYFSPRKPVLSFLFKYFCKIIPWFSIQQIAIASKNNVSKVSQS